MLKLELVSPDLPVLKSKSRFVSVRFKKLPVGQDLSIYNVLGFQLQSYCTPTGSMTIGLKKKLFKLFKEDSDLVFSRTNLIS